MAFAGSEIPAGFFMPGRRNYVKRTEKVLLMVFLVVSVICGKYLLDYWRDSYDNRQKYKRLHFRKRLQRKTRQNQMQIIQ